ncbi:MAG: Nif3-like dinuclear metal center hexameric protein [Oscillospiraceae bacterium]|nr:Nif3-like dinuclear metal center hexameric protein [Oscillospiraceae bacterium]
MPRVEEILRFVEELAPKNLAESWDNVGALVDCGNEVTSILVALDITEEVVVEAELQGCQVIVAHHPVIFTPLHSVKKTDVVYRMIKKNISGICAHTNLDAAEGGVNDILARVCGLTDVVAFAQMGRIGKLRTPITAQQLAEACKAKFGLPAKYVDAGKPITKLAVVGGAGAFIEEAVLAGADCLLTGEAKHHEAIDARARGLSLVAAGHFATEYPVVPYLADKLSKRFNGVRVLVSRRGRDPFSYTE